MSVAPFAAPEWIFSSPRYYHTLIILIVVAARKRFTLLSKCLSVKYLGLLGLTLFKSFSSLGNTVILRIV